MNAKKQTKIPDKYLAGYDQFDYDWISTSSLSLLMTCPIAWEKKYALRIPESRNVRLTVGCACHKAREVNLSQKIKTKKDLDLDSVTDAARDDAKEQFNENEISLEPEFKDKSTSTAEAIAVDMATEFAETDYEAFQKNILPAAVEEPMAVQYPELSKVIVGRIDVRDIYGYINDLKSSKAAKGQAFADDDMGLTTYALLYYISEGKLSRGIKVQNVIKTEKGACRTEEYLTKRNEGQLQQQLARFARGIKLIESGVFMPCNPRDWKCSPAWCGYYNRCEFGGNK